MDSKTHLSDLVAALGDARAKASAAYDTYKTLKAIEDDIRESLYAELQSSGLRSAKGDDFTASIAQKPTVVIKDEQAAMDWLKEAPDVETDVYIGLKATEFQSLAKSVLKGTGEIIPGTEIQIRESLAIKSNTKGGQSVTK